MENKLNKHLKWLLPVTAATAAVIAAGLYGAITVRRYEVATDKLPEGAGFRIAALADLHGKSFGKG